MIPAVALASAGLLAFASPALADVPAAGIADVVSQEIEVRLAEVEVVVTDRQGDPVAGLTPDDFEVFQDRKAVELTHFRAVAGGLAAAPGELAAAPAPAIAPGPAGSPIAAEGSEPNRLHLVVYIDRGYLQLGDLRQVREALKAFLREGMSPNDRVMLVAAATSLELEQRFTTVPELVISQLDDVRERPGGGRFAREYQSLLVDLRRVKNEGNDLDARDPRLLARAFFSQIQAYAAEVQGELRNTTGQLKQLIQSIAGLPGRRVVIYVGGRVPAAHSRQLFEAWDDAFGRNSNLQIPDQPGGPGAAAGDGDTAEQLLQDSVTFDSLTAASSRTDVDSGRVIKEVAELASRHGVVFHTLDASGMRGSSALFSAPGDATLGARGTTSSPSTAVAPSSLADSLGSLKGLAWDTGGRAFAGSSDFRGALARISSDLRTYYSLGFAPLEGSGGSSKIEVRVRKEPGRGKLEARHLPRIQLKDRDTLAAERTVSALLLEEMENPLEVEIETGAPTTARKGTWRVPVSISVPLARLALVADGRAHAGRLSIYATSGNLDRIGAVVKAVVPVRIANSDLLTSLGRRAAYQLELTLPSASGRIAVTVRDDFRPRSSTAVTQTAVAAAGPAGGPADSPNPVPE